MTEPETTNQPNVREIARALSAPFDETEVKFKPQAVKGNRALALAYVDVRAIMDRLDNVLGVENWQDDYQLRRTTRSCAGCGCGSAAGGSPRWTSAAPASNQTAATG
jgi:hypothetical protein